MKTELTAPFQAATISVFETMLDCEAQAGEPAYGDKVQARQDVTGFVQLSGLAYGVAAVSFSRGAALLATASMTGEVPKEIDDSVLDVVGEISNMVVGAAKRKLAGLDLKIGLPMVVSGVAHRLHFPVEVEGVSIPFETSWGPIIIQVALKPCEEPVPAGA